MTPRVINALVQLKERRQLGERAELMEDIRLAVNGEDVPFRRTLKRMKDEGQ